MVSNPASDPAADTDRWHTIAVWRHQAAAHYAGGRDDQADAIATSPARLAGAISYWSLSDDGGSLTRVTKLSYYTAATLDGFIADPDDSLEWLFRQEQDNSGPLNYDEFIQNIGAIVMGSTTYEWSLDHQAKTGAPWPYSMPAWVMTIIAPAMMRLSVQAKRLGLAEAQSGPLRCTIQPASTASATSSVDRGPIM